jgi:hypothetical protein
VDGGSGAPVVVRLGGLVARKWCAGERGSAVFVIEK